MRWTNQEHIYGLWLMAKISLNQAQNYLSAEAYAANLGVPWNRHLTIHWHLAGLEGRAIDLTRTLLQKSADWLEYRGVLPVWGYVIEAGYKGEHSHIRVHVPPDRFLSWRRMVDRWIKSMGGTRAKGAAKATKCLRSTGNRWLDVRDLNRYLLKDCDDKTRELLNIEKPGNRIQPAGKRIGVSQNLGPRARAA